MAYKFNITNAANEQFKFVFVYNAESIVWSENYKAKTSAINAIESIKKNAPGAATVDLTKDESGSGYRFEIVRSKDGQFFVRFVASNGETMVRSETYKAKASAINAIESVKKNGTEAEVFDETFPPVPPEPLPAQELGAHFEIHEGVIALASSPRTDDVGDLRRLRTLQPLVTEAVEELIESLNSPSGDSNDPHFRLRRHAKQYLAAIETNISMVDFGLLFGLGSMMQNRLEADQNMSAESDLPPLSDRQKSALRDFQDQHGPFITASSEGLRSLAAAEKVERNPEQERAFASDMLDLAERLDDAGSLATDEVVVVLRDAAAELGQGKQADRLTVYGSGTVRNLLIVTVASAAIATITAISLPFGPAGIGPGAAISLAILEGIKKSGAFKELSQPVTELMDNAKAADYSRFAESTYPLLLRLAGNRPEMQWLREYVTWLKKTR